MTAEANTVTAVQPECRFCAIARGAAAAELILQDESWIAFLANNPLTPGHSLLVPRVHHPGFLDLPEELAASVVDRIRLLSRALKATLKCQGVMLVVNDKVDQTVPHFHFHLVPRWQDDNVQGFSAAKGTHLHQSPVPVKTIRKELARLAQGARLKCRP